MDHIPKFKVPKTPLWSRMLGSWRAWRRARKARRIKHHIATVEMWMVREGRNTSHCAFIQLYQDGKGKRTFEFEKGTWLNHWDYTQWYDYHKTIVPWLHGKWDNNTIAAWAAKTHQRA